MPNLFSIKTLAATSNSHLTSAVAVWIQAMSSNSSMGGKRAGSGGIKIQNTSAGPGLTALGLRLSNHITSSQDNDGGSNVVFSPLSVYTALALVAQGACGDTLRELLDALGAESRDELAELVRRVEERALADRSSSGGPSVAFAGGLWHDAAWVLRPGFRAAAAKSNKSAAHAVDFKNNPEKAVSEINRWVAGATNYLIDSILDQESLQRDTRLVLANAIYFKGKWQDRPFTVTNTITDKFYLLDGHCTVYASFMRSRKKHFISVHNGFKVLRLPYKSAPKNGTGPPLARYSMSVFLPDARDGLPGLLQRMASMGTSLHSYLPMDKVPVGDFRLPKFNLSFSSNLQDVLKDNLGIRAAFDRDQADLSDMATSQESPSTDKLFVGDVYHKAVFEVNEEGTEAATVSASTVMMYSTCASFPPKPPKPVDFVADHPFVFLLIEEVSGAIMFVGHVMDPSMCHVSSLYDYYGPQLRGLARWLGRAMGLGSCM